MPYALVILWYERQRFLPAVMAVAFSALLVALQCGLLLGMVSFASLPVDHAAADVWVGAPGLASVDLGTPIREGHLARLAGQPEVERCEIYLQSFAYWARRDGRIELCMVIGSRLSDDALGAVRELTPELRARLSEPGTVVIDESDRGRLGVRGVGDVAEITGQRVRVVGMVRGLRGFIGAYVFCSLGTARSLLQIPSGQAAYLLARCRRSADAAAVAARLRAEYPDVSAFTREELSIRSRLHWLVKTKAGIALSYAAALGLLVGGLVTSQTLSAATAASLREHAVLRALGIPLRRLAGLVLTQALVVGVAGAVVALPAVYLLAWVADEMGISVRLPAWLLAATAAVILATALLSSLSSLRLLRRVELISLLR
jgi:putative ABC transport system permease protein